jgi:hypothetical protein
VSGRPELPKLKRGDTVLILGYGGGKGAREAVVESVGPKWLKAADMRFLLADQIAGQPGSRIGAASRFVTREQWAYDLETRKAERYVRHVAGLQVGRESPFADRDMLINLAAVLRELLP